jgi:hypothetical protein
VVDAPVEGGVVVVLPVEEDEDDEALAFPPFTK